MDIVNPFKDFLLTEKNKPSKVTIKNYVSDIRRFIQWYEIAYTRPFIASALTSEVIATFQNATQNNSNNSTSAPSSTKRYISSLRKFCRFLEHSGAIKANPFTIPEPVKPPEDPWLLKGFKSFLISQKASKLTIKNYIIDIKQFLLWLEKVTINTSHHANDNERYPKQGFDTPYNKFLSIDNFAVEQYKDRLLNEGIFSATSINRKLSSLRRYMRWLKESGVLEESQTREVKTKQEPEAVVVETPLPTDIPLTALRNLNQDNKLKKEKRYSSFAPFRLVQKTTKLITLGIDSVIFNPIAQTAEAIQYTLWKRSGKKIFAPVKTILDASSLAIDPLPTEKVAAEVVGRLPQITAKAASFISNAVRVKTTAKPYAIRNISKSFYAPLQISLKQLTWKQRLWHHLKHTRPAWYKIYHSYPIVHHVHFAILILATVAAGSGMFYSITDGPYSNKPALAALPPSPPRTLTFQGRLLDNTNTPISADTNLRFVLYNSQTASGSALLWQEVQEIKPDQDGYFSAILGKKTSLKQELFNNTPHLYVGMTVRSNQELKPRQQIPTVGYTSNSQLLQGLKVITKTDETENVVLALDSSGDLTIGGSASPTFQATGGQFTLSGQTLLLTTNPGTNSNVQIAPDGSGIIDLQKPIQNTTNSINASGVPGAVEVIDNLAILATAGSQSALTIRQNSNGDLISGLANGVAKFRLDATGTGIFAGNLNINGNTIGTSATTFGIVDTNVTKLTIGSSATTISLGGIKGDTTVNNNLKVTGSSTFAGAVTTTGEITANGGVVLPAGKTIKLTDFTPGALPFININNQITHDAANFAWAPASRSLNIIGSLCLRSTTGACAGTAPGTIYASNATVQAADLAENYISSQKLEPGDIVVPEASGNSLAIVKATAPYQPEVIGIISSNPGFTLNSDAKTDPTHPNIYPLALQGRVPLKVSTVNGVIKTGDPLTSSSIPGVAMKATQHGQIIGKALEDYASNDTAQVNKIMAFVNISYHSPRMYLTDNGTLSITPKDMPNDNLGVNSDTTITNGAEMNIYKNLIVSIEDGLLQIKNISTQSLRVATDNITIGNIHISNYISGIVKDVLPPYLTQMIYKLPAENPIASSSASLKIADTTASSSAATDQTMELVNNDQSLNPNISPLYNSIATPSAALKRPQATISNHPTPSLLENALVTSEAGTLNSTGIFSSPEQIDLLNAKSPSELGLEKLDTKDVTVSKTLSVFGRSTLSDVGITGKVNIGLLTINGLNDEGQTTINTTSGPLKIQSDGFNGIDFLHGKISIDTKGNLNVTGNALFAKDVTVKGRLATNIIAPIPGSDITIKLDAANQTKQKDSSFIIHGSEGKNVLKVTTQGDVSASGSGNFANINIIRGVQADTSNTQTTADGSAGKGLIKAKQKERTIYTPFVTKHALIYVTATSDTQAMTPYVARQSPQDNARGTKGSFTIQIPKGVNKDITFNWWIVN